MQIQKLEFPDSDYEVAIYKTLTSMSAVSAQVGVVSFGKGKRSPEQGLGVNPQHEVAIVMEGSFSVETEDGIKNIEAGDIITSDANEAHAVTALEAGKILFMLFGEDVRF